MPSEPPRPSEVYRECLRCMLISIEETTGRAQKDRTAAETQEPRQMCYTPKIVVSCTDNDRTSRRVLSREG